jgi:O-glycosyl hydrolase
MGYTQKKFKSITYKFISVIVLFLATIPTVFLVLHQQNILQFAQTGTSTVIIDANTRYQTMNGFGTSERVFDDPHLTNTFDAATQRGAVIIPQSAQAEILGKLYGELGLTRVRSVTEAGIEPSKGSFNFAWKRNDAHIEYVKQAMSYGLTTYFLSPVTLENWMDESNPQDYVTHTMTILRRWKAQGVEPPYYSIINEPGFSRSGIWSGDWIKTVTISLGRQLKAEGFKTKLVIPDDVRASEAYNRASVVLADSEARSYIGALAFHLYDESINNVEKMKQLSDQYGIPLWMSEFYSGAMSTAGLPADALSWGDLMYQLISTYNVSAIDYMWGFFGQWDNAQLISITHSGNSYTGYQLKKEYYVMGQYSRFVKAGALRISAQSSNSVLHVTAFTNPDHSVAIVAVNTGGTDTTTTFSLLGADGISSFPTVIRTSNNENWVTLPTVSIENNTFTINLKAKSITTLTSTSGSAQIPTATPNLTVEPTFYSGGVGSQPTSTPIPTVSSSNHSVGNSTPHQSCREMDGSQHECSQHSTCQYFTCSNTCWPQGTAQSQACPSQHDTHQQENPIVHAFHVVANTVSHAFHH